MAQDAVYSPLGAAIETGEIATGAVTAAKMAAGAFVLIERQSFSAEATVDFTSISGYSHIIAIFDFGGDTNNVSLLMRINNDSSGDYHYIDINNVTLTARTSATQAELIGPVGGSNKSHCAGIVTFNVDSDLNEVNANTYAASLSGRSQTGNKLLYGNLQGSADVTQLNFFASAGNISGIISIYGVKD